MPNHNIEKEVKIKLDDPNAFEKMLHKLGARHLGTALQRTVRLDFEDDSLEKQGKFLRVRSGFENVVTFKQKIDNNNKVFKRKEIETKVEDIDKLRIILNQLGLTKECIMEKYRSDWTFNSVQISIDKLPFGIYVEIEGEEEKIESAVAKLGLASSERITVTYWDLFEEHKKQTGQIGNDIIFDNT